MEGPSLRLAAEELNPFCEKIVDSVSGNTKIGKERLVHQRVHDIFSWGKHLVFQFDDFAIRVHFLMFGSYRAKVNGVDTEGDYKKPVDMIPRLALTFKNGEVRMYNCSIKIIESSNAKSTYDFSVDVLADQWDDKKALKKVLQRPHEEIADVLLDQEIFAGVGNIIKNEILSLTHVHPQSHVEAIPLAILKDIIKRARTFSQQFYKWRKIYQLRKHLQIYRKKVCPYCQSNVLRQKTGKRERMSHFCPNCQTLYDA